MRGDAVGKIEQRGGKRAGDESGLHAHGEPGASGIVKLPEGCERGGDGGGGEPHAHREKFGEEEECDGRPFRHLTIMWAEATARSPELHLG